MSSSLHTSNPANIETHLHLSHGWMSFPVALPPLGIADTPGRLSSGMSPSGIRSGGIGDRAAGTLRHCG